MKDPQYINWRKLSGNKFSRSLHPNMLTEDKYYRQMLVKLPNDADKKLYIVEYDRDYVINYIGIKFIDSLAPLKAVDIGELVQEAYQDRHKYDLHVS